MVDLCKKIGEITFFLWVVQHRWLLSVKLTYRLRRRLPFFSRRDPFELPRFRLREPQPPCFSPSSRFSAMPSSSSASSSRPQPSPNIRPLPPPPTAGRHGRATQADLKQLTLQLVKLSINYCIGRIQIFVLPHSMKYI